MIDFKDINGRIPKWLKNRYSVTVILFLIWMTFFDQNDFVTLYNLRSELNSIRQEKLYYREQIQETGENLDNLLNDREKLEKYAREKYLMKKDDEDIFVLVVDE